MGSVKKVVKKVVKYGTLGAVDMEASKKAEQAAKRQAAELEAENKKAEQNAQQSENRNRQESADLAALEEDTAEGHGEMAGILTSVDGLSKGDRQLAKKKKLGG